MAEYDDTIEEELGMSGESAPAALFAASVTDTFRAPAFVVETRGLPMALVDGVGAGAAASFAYWAGDAISDQVGLTAETGGATLLALTLTEVLGLQESAFLGLLAELSETIGLADAVVVVEAVRVVERLGLSPVAILNGLFTRSATDTFRFNETLRLFLGADVSDTFEISDAAMQIMRSALGVSENLGVEADVTPLFLLAATVQESVALGDPVQDNWIFQPEIFETIQFRIGYLAPNNNFTAWAVNTLTSGVSEYQNYQFNSFARLDNEYIGANDEGLFELSGAHDDGNPIIAHIKSGLIQAIGSKFIGFKAVYLGLRGDASGAPLEFVLRIETGNGKIYDYQVLANPMFTSKVNIGKGLRTRYWSFELISIGQDFDLESVEFVPMLANRRV